MILLNDVLSCMVCSNFEPLGRTNQKNLRLCHQKWIPHSLESRFWSERSNLSLEQKNSISVFSLGVFSTFWPLCFLDFVVFFEFCDVFFYFWCIFRFLWYFFYSIGIFWLLWYLMTIVFLFLTFVVFFDFWGIFWLLLVYGIFWVLLLNFCGIFRILWCCFFNFVVF